MAALGGTRAGFANEQLIYVLTPNPDTGRLRVELTWHTQGRHASVLKVLPRWGSISDVSALIKNLTFTGSPRGRRVGRRWNINHGKNAVISCQYEVDSGQREIVWGGAFKPTVTRDFFHGIGATFLLTPEATPGVPREFDVMLRWKLPRGWNKAACSWGVGRTIGMPMTTSDLLHSVYYAGDLVSRTQKVLGQNVTVVMRDAFGFDVAKFSSMAAEIVSQQRVFMDDDTFPPFVITAVPVGKPLPKGSSRIQGSGLYRSFAAFIAPESHITGAVEHLFAHELFHYWNGRILDRDEPEELVYWFSEGLSDYYALRILFESGRWSAGKYAKWINKHIAEYQHNPARNADNDAIRRGFWSKRNTVGEVAYQRGLLLGLRWHKLARDNGRRDGLDRLFKTLVQRARTRGFKLSNAKIRRAGVELLGKWFGPDFDRFVTRAETVELPADALAPKLRGVVQPVYEYQLGFERDKSFTSNRVKGLVRGSAAENAGLRENDVLLGWSVHADTDRQTILQIRRGDVAKTIRYYPRGRGIETVQFKLTRPTAAKRP